jgi:transcriptional regulator with XRE-family HTH domain
MKRISSQGEKPAPSELGERLLFTVWLAGKILGAQNAKQFAEVIGKGAAQLSKWVQGKPRPSWESIKLVADSVGIDPVWLDDPTRAGAAEPADFAQWLAAKRGREQDPKPNVKRA